MEQKINVAQLLKDCPKGMELDCTMFENLEFDYVDENPGTYPIVCRVKTEFGNYNIYTFTEYGCYRSEKYSKCVIFPKGKTTWEGFIPPCKFKDGDVIFTQTDDYAWVSIFKQFSGNSCCTHIDLCINDNDLIIDTRCLCDIGEINTQRLATEEEKQKLFQAIKDNGYKWDPETKTLEELIEPKFKVGDRIKRGEKIATIVRIYKNCYNVKYDIGFGVFTIDLQDEWELVPNKFDISTLKAFESRVLVRDYDNQIWIPTFWGKYLEDDSNCSYLTTNGCYKYCIPYEHNQHLLGTTDDCDGYYKTWE